MAHHSSKYDPDKHPRQVEMLCQRGAVDREIAEFLGVAVTTIYHWCAEHIEFAESMRAGKEIADDRVERSLYNRAVGYSYDAVKIVTVSQGQNMGSEVQEVPYVEHVPPDVKAAIRWLEARRPDVWRRTMALETKTPDLPDEAKRFDGITDGEADTLRALLTKAAAGADGPVGGPGRGLH